MNGRVDGNVVASSSQEREVLSGEGAPICADLGFPMTVQDITTMNPDPWSCTESVQTQGEH